MEKVLIKGGRIVTAVDDYVGDLLLEGGRIEAIGRSLDVADAAVHDRQRISGDARRYRCARAHGNAHGQRHRNLRYV